jgi:adenylate kinase
MRIVLLGAPGSGKGTQAAMLRDRLKLVHISTGDLLRQAVAAGTELGKQAKAVMDAGKLVSDGLVLDMLEDRLSQPDIGAGIIFDGYPRNLVQSDALSNLLARMQIPLQRAVLLDVAEDTLFERLAERAKKEQRVDDTPETIRNRLKVYHEQTEPVVGYYESRGLVRKVKGEGTVEEIYARVAGAIMS